MAVVGFNQFFRPSLGVRTLLFTRSERDQTTPRQLVVANTSAADPVEVTIELYSKRFDVTRYISKLHEVPLARTHIADLTPFPMRQEDQLYVTVSADADVTLFFAEPLESAACLP